MTSNAKEKRKNEMKRKSLFYFEQFLITALALARQTDIHFCLSSHLKATYLTHKMN